MKHGRLLLTLQAFVFLNFFFLTLPLYAESPIIRYSVMSAIKADDLDSNLTVKEALQNGDFGIGGFSAFSGELILLDGTMYKIPYDGIPRIAKNTDGITYIELTRFSPTYTLPISKSLDKNAVIKLIDKKTADKNLFYTIKITGTFSVIQYRTMKVQNAKTDKICAKNFDHVFTEKNIAGTLIGFINPPYVKGGIDYPGTHLHFISSNHQLGGHVYNFSITNGTIEIGVHHEFILRIPESKKFAHLDLDKNIQCPNQN